MREILFRGKRIDNGEWVEGAFLNDRDGAFYICPAVSDISYGDNGNRRRIGCWYSVDPSTVGQYTGRLDKNGKRVFEGDILRLFTIWADGTVEPVDVPVIVQFWENDQCYVLVTKQGYHCDDFGNLGRPEYYEVIGNIHDNPELVKED